MSFGEYGDVETKNFEKYFFWKMGYMEFQQVFSQDMPCNDVVYKFLVRFFTQKGVYFVVVSFVIMNKLG